MITKEDVENWCEENNYILIDSSVERIPIETIIKVAKSVTGVDDITLKNRREDYVAARFMIIEYLKNYFPNKVIAEATGLSACMISDHIGNKSQILEEDEKYLRAWERFMVNSFKAKVKEIEEQLNIENGKKEN